MNQLRRWLTEDEAMARPFRFPSPRQENGLPGDFALWQAGEVVRETPLRDQVIHPR